MVLTSIADATLSPHGFSTYPFLLGTPCLLPRELKNWKGDTAPPLCGDGEKARFCLGRLPGVHSTSLAHTWPTSRKTVATGLSTSPCHTSYRSRGEQLTEATSIWSLNIELRSFTQSLSSLGPQTAFSGSNSGLVMELGRKLVRKQARDRQGENKKGWVAWRVRHDRPDPRGSRAPVKSELGPGTQAPC